MGKRNDTSYKMWTTDGVLSIRDCQRNLIRVILKINGLYQIPSWEHAYTTTVDRLVSLYEAHCMSGHQNYAYVKHMFNNNQVCGIKLDPKQLEEPECRTCMLAKATRYPIARMRSTPHAENFRDIFHMDVWGPASVRTVDHCIYTVMVIDEATYWLEEPLMKSKDESFTEYIILQTGLQTQYSTMVKILHSD